MPVLSSLSWLKRRTHFKVAPATGGKVLSDNTNNIGNSPIESQTTGEHQGKKAKHEGHHQRHHSLRGLLPGVSDGRAGHLLLCPHCAANYDGQNPIWIRLSQIEPQETAT